MKIDPNTPIFVKSSNSTVFDLIKMTFDFLQHASTEYNAIS